ncbi:MAG TPA: YopT-type cysteine protease domain-containing protein, partial [Labilithrix sp.]|nr:YopT-type cysteine protease domain-containing protein [Labilithrix sp.]
ATTKTTWREQPCAAPLVRRGQGHVLAFQLRAPHHRRHQMAFWSDGSRSRFFDPHFGVISFSWQSGLMTCPTPIPFPRRKRPICHECLERRNSGVRGNQLSTTELLEILFGFVAS